MDLNNISDNSYIEKINLSEISEPDNDNDWLFKYQRDIGNTDLFDKSVLSEDDLYDYSIINKTFIWNESSIAQCQGFVFKFNNKILNVIYIGLYNGIGLHCIGTSNPNCNIIEANYK